MQETPESELNAPFGFGVGWMDQVVPFQASASVDEDAGLFELPTAVHAVEDVHETPDSELAAAPLGLGVESSIQVVPFQPSARVTGAPVPDESYPTAVQAVDDVHETALSWLLVAPTGFGLA